VGVFFTIETGTVRSRSVIEKFSEMGERKLGSRSFMGCIIENRLYLTPELEIEGNCGKKE